jgi:hypothetical protein
VIDLLPNNSLQWPGTIMCSAADELRRSASEIIRQRSVREGSYA